MNLPVKVDFGGQPRSKGSKRKVAPEQWTKERRETGGGNPSRHSRSSGRGHLPRSPEAFVPSIESSCIEREVEIKKTEVCGMEGVEVRDRTDERCEEKNQTRRWNESTQVNRARTWLPISP